VSPAYLTRIHHLGICVHRLELALATYQARLGLSASGPLLRNDEVRAALLVVGDSQLELFEPLVGDGALARFLERRGEGLHHVAYQVDDIDRALARLAADGARLIDRQARPGLHQGWRIAFIHPASTAGVLTELVEVDPAADTHRPTQS
jgi:methylmalonyl-CoA/ethylmalonyl-CoA epimerase